MYEDYFLPYFGLDTEYASFHGYDIKANMYISERPVCYRSLGLFLPANRMKYVNFNGRNFLLIEYVDDGCSSVSIQRTIDRQILLIYMCQFKHVK